MDLQLTNGDLFFANGDLVLVDGVDAIAQQVMISLRTFLGEWYRDPTVGIPYFQDVLVKTPRTEQLKSLFSRACLRVPGVLEVDSMELAFDRANRTLVMSELRLLVTGDVLIDFPPFVVGGDQ